MDGEGKRVIQNTVTKLCKYCYNLAKEYGKYDLTEVRLVEYEQCDINDTRAFKDFKWKMK